MGLFTQLEKFDQKLTRGYARWGRWVWRTLIVVPVLVVLWNIGQAVWGGPRGGVILEIHSEIDRPILGFSVNGVAGANAFANGGGSITCCGDVSGDTAEVIWTLSTTRTQYNAGMRLEKRNMTLPLPKREWEKIFCMCILCLAIKCCWGGVKILFLRMKIFTTGGTRPAFGRM